MLQRRRIPLDRKLSSSERAVELFLQQLPQRLDEDWDVPRMAAACGLGTTRFAQYCRRLTQTAPNAYLTRCRVEAAARLLRAAPQQPITHIAFRCGFRSSQYFATVFREQMGMTPRTYRAAARGTDG
jgi:AraC family L-rhamnose operon regulatory protein RhaS